MLRWKPANRRRSWWLAIALGSLSVALAPSVALAQCPDPWVNWADRLGYGSTNKVLVMHADDAGMFLGTNSAIEDLLQSGLVDSAAVMPAPPYYADMVARHNAAGNLDLGIHLTFNSEWESYRWGPVFRPPRGVKRILEHKFLFWGWKPYFPGGSFYTWLYRGPKTLEKELRAQVSAALDGLPTWRGRPAVPKMVPPPTHIDSHMGAVFVRKSHFKKYLKVSLELATTHPPGVPALTFENWEFTASCMSDLSPGDPMLRLVNWVTRRLEKAQRSIADWPYPRLDQYCGVPDGADLASTRDSLAERIHNLPAGITQFFFHPSDEDTLLRSATTSDTADRRIVIDRHLLDPVAGSDLDTVLAGVKRTNWTKMMARFQRTDLCTTNPSDGGHWEKPSCCP